MEEKVRAVSFSLSYHGKKRDGAAQAILLIPPHYSERRKDNGEGKKALIVLQEDFLKKDFWGKVCQEERNLVLLVRATQNTVYRILRSSAVYLSSTYGTKTVLVAGSNQFLNFLPERISYRIESINGEQKEFSICIRLADIEIAP